jgi:hypothetical protein
MGQTPFPPTNDFLIQHCRSQIPIDEIDVSYAVMVQTIMTDQRILDIHGHPPVKGANIMAG